jgi:hypothetical protein
MGGSSSLILYWTMSAHDGQQEHGSWASRARMRLGSQARLPCTVRGVDVSSKHIYDRSGLKRWERDGVLRHT